MSEFTSPERAAIHSALDAIILRRQPYDVQGARKRRVWPSTADYEAHDAAFRWPR